MERKLSDTDCVVQTPDRKQNFCLYGVCHVNMLKRLFSRERVMPVSTVPLQYHLADDGLVEKSGLMVVARLRNSEL